MSMAYMIETQPEVELSFFWEGGAIFEMFDEIEELCKKRRLPVPAQFVSEDRFFPPSEGIEYFERLAKAIDRSPRAFPDEGESVLAAVEDLVELLKEIDKKGAQFRLHIG